MMNNTCIVTGGAGFIGGNFIHRWLNTEKERVVNIDKMTYAANPRLLEELKEEPNHLHERVDIADIDLIRRLFREHKPRYIVHFAGESHVDRSISDPLPFLHTNITGTFSLLEAARTHYQSLSRLDKANFRFIHISTDEVFGSLNLNDQCAFSETNRYEPSTPYAATKAASDHLVRSWWTTYEVPTILISCSNNYGPRQSPEKLIPKTIHRILAGERVPVYGDGLHVRDWLYVEDCTEAIMRVIRHGRIGDRYNIGGRSEKSVLEIVNMIWRLLDRSGAERESGAFANIEFVADRLGNDRRYALCTEKIENELDWIPTTSFEVGIQKTIEWYLRHRDWLIDADGRMTFGR